MSPADRTTESTFALADVTVPESIHAPDAAHFIGMAEVRSAVEAELMGGSPEVVTAEELLPLWRDDTVPMSGVVAIVEGRVVGRGSLALPAGATECWIGVSVLPAFRNRGIGAALYDRLERRAESAGRRIIQNQTTFPAGVAGEGIAAPTGFGTVPSDLASTRFLQHRGFTLEQVGRLSALSLPMGAADLSSRLSRTSPFTRGYRTVTWQGRTPEAWMDGLAHLRTRMSTDTPNAGIQQTEDIWTAERVRSVDDLWATSPRILLTTIAVHDATGQAVGYTELDVPAEPHRPVEQVDTLVLREHRGHRIGTLLKLTNLRELARRFPEHGSVQTTNAEDNRHMLDVNEAIGFAPLCYSARWKRVR